jgi:hypothetical protein
MSSGESYEVRHPEMAFLTKSDMLIGIEPGKDNIPADFRICSLLHISAVDPLPVGRGGAKRGAN